MHRFRFKLSLYWGSKWKTYFGLYYAVSFEAAHTALEGYSFPVTEKRRCGWAIEDMTTKEVYFERREALPVAIQASTKDVWHGAKRRF